MGLHLCTTTSAPLRGMQDRGGASTKKMGLINDILEPDFTFILILVCKTDGVLKGLIFLLVVQPYYVVLCNECNRLAIYKSLSLYRIGHNRLLSVNPVLPSRHVFLLPTFHISHLSIHLSIYHYQAPSSSPNSYLARGQHINLSNNSQMNISIDKIINSIKERRPLSIHAIKASLKKRRTNFRMNCSMLSFQRTYSLHIHLLLALLVSNKDR